jgi:peptidoglycan/xylan/chitin deacetylase (PgdA/CDA1 family)
VIAATRRAPPIPILLYHSISDTASQRFRRWAVRPEQFAAQVAHLRARSYTPLTVAQLAAATARNPADLPPRPVVLTFDDGFADFYDRALPVLQEHRFTATLYVATGFVGGTSRWLRSAGEGERPMLTWVQLRELRARGIECGAHGHSHRPLDELPRRVALDEIARSTGLVADATGAPVVTFAYPHGYYDRAVREMVRMVGHVAACAVKHALSAPDDDRFALARVVVEADTDLDRFSRLLAGEGLPVAPAERLRTKGWRLLRKAAARVGGRLAAPAGSRPEGTHARVSNGWNR